MTKILLICHDIPSLSVGATLPIYHLIKQLGSKHEIHLISFDSEKYSLDSIKDKLSTTNTLKIPEYHSKEELKDVINYYMEHSDKRNEKIKELQKIVLNKHTYTIRAKKLKRIIEEYEF